MRAVGGLWWRRLNSVSVCVVWERSLFGGRGGA